MLKQDQVSRPQQAVREALEQDQERLGLELDQGPLEGPVALDQDRTLQLELDLSLWLELGLTLGLELGLILQLELDLSSQVVEALD